MFARLSNLFKKEDDKPKLDIKDLLLQKNLTPQEKQLIKNSLEDERDSNNTEITAPQSTEPTDVVMSEPTDVIEPSEVVVSAPEPVAPNYEYKESTYKRRQD